MDSDDERRLAREERRRQRALDREKLGLSSENLVGASGSPPRPDGGDVASSPPAAAPQPELGRGDVESDSDSGSDSDQPSDQSESSGSESDSDDDDSSSEGSSSAGGSDDEADLPLEELYLIEKERRKAAQNAMSSLVKQIGTYKQIVEEEKAEIEADCDRLRSERDEIYTKMKVSVEQRDAEVEKLKAQQKAAQKENMENLSTLLKEMALIEESNADVEQQLEDVTEKHAQDQAEFLKAGELVDELQGKVDALTEENKELKRSLASAERSAVLDSAKKGDAKDNTESLVDEVLRLRKEVAAGKKRIGEADKFLRKARGALGVSEDGALAQPDEEALARVKDLELQLAKSKAERQHDRHKMSAMKKRIEKLTSTLSRVAAQGAEGGAPPDGVKSPVTSTKDKRRSVQPGKRQVLLSETPKSASTDRLSAVSDVVGFQHKKIDTNQANALLGKLLDSPRGGEDSGTADSSEGAVVERMALFVRKRQDALDVLEEKGQAPWLNFDLPDGDAETSHSRLWSAVALALQVPRKHVRVVALGDSLPAKTGSDDTSSSVPTSFTTELDAEAAAELSSGDYLEAVVDPSFDADEAFSFPPEQNAPQTPDAEPSSDTPKKEDKTLEAAAAMFGFDAGDSGMQDILEKMKARETGAQSPSTITARRRNQRSSMLFRGFSGSMTNLRESGSTSSLDIKPEKKPKKSKKTKKAKAQKPKKEKPKKLTKRNSSKKFEVSDPGVSEPNAGAVQQNKMMIDTKTGSLIVVRPGEEPPEGAVPVDSFSASMGPAVNKPGSRATVSFRK